MGQFLEFLQNKPQGPWLYGVSRSVRYGNVNNHDEDDDNGADIGNNDDNAKPGAFNLRGEQCYQREREIWEAGGP